MLLSLFLLSLQASPDIATYLPLEIAEREGYALSSLGRKTSLVWKSSTSPPPKIDAPDLKTRLTRDRIPATLSVVVQAFDTDRGKKLRLSSLEEADAPGLPSWRPNEQPFPPSGLPIGYDALWSSDGTVFGLYAKADREFTLVIFSELPTSDSRGFAKHEPRDRTGDQDLVERFSRHLIANLAGRRLAERRTGALDGKQVLVRRNTLRGFDHVDLQTWAKARGWTLNLNAQRGTAAMTKGDRLVIIPLGSGTIKVGSEWKDAQDLIAQVDGRWYVPMPALEQHL
jgi:hypothetical protein